MNHIACLSSEVKIPMMNLPVRSTFVKCSTGGVLISPGSSLDVVKLNGLNGVTDLVAPNLFHCAGIKRSLSVFPQATVWGPVGARTLKPDIPWSKELSLSAWPYQDELSMVTLSGIPSLNEAIFYHRESRSLIITDLCFNLSNPSGIGAWFVLNLAGTYKKCAVSRLFLREVKDRISFKNSLEEVLTFDFDNVILAHGDNLIGNGKARLLEALKKRDLV